MRVGWGVGGWGGAGRVELSRSERSREKVKTKNELKDLLPSFCREHAMAERVG